MLVTKTPPCLGISKLSAFGLVQQVLKTGFKLWYLVKRRRKMSKEVIKRIIGSTLLALLILIGTSQDFIRYMKIPTSVVVFKGDHVDIPTNQLLDSTVKDSESVAAFQTNDKSLNITGESVGQSEVVFNLAGIPVKKTSVRVLKEFRVVPGGQSIGVQLNTLGVLVVGYHKIKGAAGERSPGEEAGILIGDIISEINGTTVTNMNSISDILQKVNSESVDVKIIRDKKEQIVKLKPEKDVDDQTYKIGLYIRDSAAGIGTLTFLDPVSMKYGALGHVISDADTKTPIVVRDGTIYRSTITSIDKGENGTPGEKLAHFASDGEEIGTIVSNTPFGIFGKMTASLESNHYDGSLPIALSSEVKKGPAEILTVIDGKKVEKFSVEVVSSVSQKFPATKGLIIKITDPRLLDKTGGIVQGMSGSPIIQNGKLIGAVTHVFVNDPTSGYGVHIEWMLQEAGINIYESDQKAG